MVVSFHLNSWLPVPVNKGALRFRVYYGHGVLYAHFSSNAVDS